MKVYILILYLLLCSTFAMTSQKTVNGKKLNNVLELNKKKDYREIAKSFQHKMEFDSAIFYFNKALQITNEDEEKSNLYEDIGMVFFYKNDFLNTLDNFKQSLYYAKEVGTDSLIARRYSDIGVVYDYLGAYDKSTENYYKALEIFEREGDLLAVSKIYNNLGVINQNREQKKDALEFYEKSLKIKKDVKADEVLVASSYVNIGSVYEDLEDENNSLKFYYKALKIFDSKKSKKYISLVLGNVASVKLNAGDIDSSDYYIAKAISINKSIDNRLGLVLNYYIKGKLFFYKKQTDSAIFYNKKALKLADTLNVVSEKSKVLLELVKLYKEKKDYKNAFLFYEKLSIAKDSLNSKDANDKIETLRIVYETEKKDKEIDNLQKDISKNRVLLFIISLVLILISLIIFLFFKQKLTKTKYEADLFNQKLLRLQMNPHFIFNALASIQSFMFEKDVKKAALYLSSFSKLTRSILNNSREEFISLQEDVDTTDNYLKIQQMRFENKFDYDIIIDEEIDPEYVQVPPMLIQPFVENAVIHGFKDIDYIGKIKVEYKRKNDSIEVIVEDNGKGIDLQSEKSHKSHALSITKERLKILNNNKKRLISFQISDNEEKKGVKVIFLIPFLTQK